MLAAICVKLQGHPHITTCTVTKPVDYKISTKSWSIPGQYRSSYFSFPVGQFFKNTVGDLHKVDAQKILSPSVHYCRHGRGGLVRGSGGIIWVSFTQLAANIIVYVTTSARYKYHENQPDGSQIVAGFFLGKKLNNLWAGFDVQTGKGY